MDLRDEETETHTTTGLICPLLTIAQAIQPASTVNRDFTRDGSCVPCLEEGCAFWRLRGINVSSGPKLVWSYCGLAGDPEERTRA